MDESSKISALISELNSMGLPEAQESLNLLLKVHAEVLQSIYDSKPSLDEGEVHIETLIIKMIFTSKNILDMSFGLDFNTLDEKKLEIIDVSSVYILLRSVIETFLTLEYLFFNNLSRAEKNFRYNLWRVSGFMSRQSIIETEDRQHVEKLEKEKKLISEINHKIINSEYFSLLTRQQKNQLKKYGLPRLKSWSELINESRLTNQIFKQSYKLCSNYAHSEYISMIQINEGDFRRSSKHNTSVASTSINCIRMIHSVTIFLLKEKFECVANSYDKLSDEIRLSVEVWEGIGKGGSHI